MVELGFPKATFAAVAELLQVTEMTVYRHVENRRGLMAAGLEVAFGEHRWPEVAGGWRDVLRRYALETWLLWERYPGAAAEVAAGAFPAGFVGVWADAIDQLLVAGFGAAEATVAADLVFDLAATDRRGSDSMAVLTPTDQDQLMATMQTGWERTLRQRDPATRERLLAARAASDAAFDLTPQEWFLLRLDIVLDGIAVSLAPRED
ncbi:MAG: hypothetical protein QM804_14955 [Propionicimonas sp.]